MYSNKGKKIKPYLLALRNNGPTFSNINKSFYSLPENLFYNFLVWNYPRYKHHPIFNGLRTTNPSNIGRWVRREFPTPSEALRWVNAICDLCISDISDSNLLTLSIDEAGENFQYAKDIALEALSKKKISFLHIGYILFYISKSNGLDQQKKWMNENLFDKSKNISNLLYYFKGVATEGGRDPLEVMDTICKIFANSIQDDKLFKAVYNVIFGMPLTSETFCNLLEYISYQSAIDQYEAAANLLCSNITLNINISEKEKRSFLLKMKSAKDWRFESIEFLESYLCKDYFYFPIDDENQHNIPENLRSSRLSTLEERELRTLFADYYFGIPSTPSAYLASSYQVTRQAQSIEEFMQGISRREVAYAYYYKENLKVIKRRKVKIEFYSLLDAIKSIELGLEKRELFRLMCLVGIKEKRFSEVLIALYLEAKIDKGMISFFPAKIFFENTSEDELLSCAADPRIAVAVSKIKEALGDEADETMYLIVEKFILEKKVDKPSMLVIENTEIEDFLYEVCTIECLEKDIDFILDSDIEDERLSILVCLKNLNNKRKKIYEEDIHKIIGKQTVDELLKRYEIGKIHCDELAIQNWAREALSAKFTRLRDHIDSGLLPVEKGSVQEFISHISTGKQETFVFRVPSSEAYNMGRSIIEELLDRYALDPRHGVDSYLSLGMRHGALIDHLRTPLARHHMITNKGILGYEPANYWTHLFSSSGDLEIGMDVSKAIMKFSEYYDAELKKIKDNLIQVRRKEKPFGIIDLEWNDAETMSFMSLFSKVTTLDEFLEEFSNFYWQVTDLKLEISRSEIDNSIKPTLFGMISDLESDVAKSTGFNRLGPFTDAVMRAKEELGIALKDLISWHNLAKSADVEPIALVDIFSAAQKIVKRLHPEFTPNVSIQGDTHVTLTSSLNVLIEVFKALFTNVYLHSNFNNPKIDLYIDAADVSVLRVDFCSSCRDISIAKEAARVATQRIATGEYESRLPTEGGSGLPKIARATVHNGKPRMRIWVDEDKAFFCVSIAFSLVRI